MNIAMAPENISMLVYIRIVFFLHKKRFDQMVSNVKSYIQYNNIIYKIGFYFITSTAHTRRLTKYVDIEKNRNKNIYFGHVILFRLILFKLVQQFQFRHHGATICHYRSIIIFPREENCTRGSIIQYTILSRARSAVAWRNLTL